MGFRSVGVPFDVPPRQRAAARAGAPRQLLRFALDGIASFTTIPLRVWSYLGLVDLAVRVLLRHGHSWSRRCIYGTDVPGFPTLIISVMFFAGVQLISLGVIGEYLGRMYEEVKGRPLFLVAEELGLERGASRPTPPPAQAARGMTAPSLGIAPAPGSRRRASMIILCADDYAMTEGVSRAIGELAAAQRLSATSVMVTSPHWPATAPRLAVHRGHLSIGLHLNLTLGRPLGADAAAAPPAARFPSRNAPDRAGPCSASLDPRRRSATRSSASSIASRRACGFPPDHIDGHQHVHVLPGVRQALLDAVARRYPGTAAADPRSVGPARAPSPRARPGAGQGHVVAALALGFARAARDGAGCPSTTASPASPTSTSARPMPRSCSAALREPGRAAPRHVPPRPSRRRACPPRSRGRRGGAWSTMRSCGT